MVRCTRLRWLATSADACREIPVDAASDTMATSFFPFMNSAAAAKLVSLTALVQKVGEQSNLLTLPYVAGDRK